MSFATDWLDLRESYDAKARDPEIAKRLSAWSDGREHLNIVDLGSGTGANLRWLAPRLRCAQSWTLVEHDQALIEAGQARLTRDIPWRYAAIDLAADLEQAIPDGTDLITASALLDLVSEAWLERLLQLVTSRKLAIYVALTFNGEIELHPPVAGDETMILRFNRHQMIDKGFGPALGGEASDRLSRAIDFTVLPAPSEWVLGPDDRRMMQAFVDGMADAARELEPEAEAEIETWRRERLELAERGVGGAFIGHDDVFAPNGIILA